MTTEPLRKLLLTIMQIESERLLATDFEICCWGGRPSSDMEYRMGIAEKLGYIECRKIDLPIYLEEKCVWAITELGKKFLSGENMIIGDPEKLYHSLATINRVANLIGSVAVTDDQILHHGYKNRKEMEVGLAALGKNGFIKRVLNLKRNEYFWEITKCGHEFLKSYITKPVDELSEMKWLLNRIKYLGKADFEIYKNSTLNKAVRLGLVVHAGGYWRLTEFGEEFLLEVGDDK